MLRRLLLFQNETVNALCFGANSKYLVSGGSSGLVKIWDMKRKEMFKPLAVSAAAIALLRGAMERPWRPWQPALCGVRGEPGCRAMKGFPTWHPAHWSILLPCRSAVLLVGVL